MRKITLEFSDETDKVLVETTKGKTTSNDLLSSIRALTIILQDLFVKNNAPAEKAVVLVYDAVREGIDRFAKDDILRSPNDLSPWRKEESNE